MVQPRGTLVSDAVSSVRDGIAIGIGLAAVVLFVFLRSWKITLIGILVVPVVHAVTGLLLSVLGMGLNLMTLGGAAAAVGLIVDDTMEETASGLGKRLGSRQNLQPPLHLRSLFSCRSLLNRRHRCFLQGAVADHGCALLISFFVSWLVVPVIADGVLRKKDAAQKAPGRVGRSLSRWYRASLGFGLRRPWLALTIALPLAGAGYFAFHQVGAGFLPAMDAVELSIDYRQSADDVRHLQIRATDGHRVPLERIAQVDTIAGQPEIDRENLRRMVAVTARVHGRSVGTVAAEVESILKSNNFIPKEITYELGGRYKQQLIAMRDLTIVFVPAEPRLENHGDMQKFSDRHRNIS